MYVEFEYNFTPSKNQEILELKYECHKDFITTTKLLSRLPVRWTTNPLNPAKQNTIKVIVKKRND